MVKIKAPNRSYTGQSAGVSFINGEAETSDKWLIEWFKNKGYEVDDSAEHEAEKLAKEKREALEDEEKAKVEAEAKAEDKKEKKKASKKEGE